MGGPGSPSPHSIRALILPLNNTNMAQFFHPVCFRHYDKTQMSVCDTVFHFSNPECFLSSLMSSCPSFSVFQGIVSGVLLVTPSNIMFDPHKSDCLVQERGCEEYGIMCPLEEVQSTAMCREITDIRIRELVPL